MDKKNQCIYGVEVNSCTSLLSASKMGCPHWAASQLANLGFQALLKGHGDRFQLERQESQQKRLISWTSPSCNSLAYRIQSMSLLPEQVGQANPIELRCSLR